MTWLRRLLALLLARRRPPSPRPDVRPSFDPWRTNDTRDRLPVGSAAPWLWTPRQREAARVAQARRGRRLEDGR
jgi:hypothetical protein